MKFALCQRCGHYRDWHNHHRPGSDCSKCPCQKFKSGRLRSRIKGFFGL